MPGVATVAKIGVEDYEYRVKATSKIERSIEKKSITGQFKGTGSVQLGLKLGYYYIPRTENRARSRYTAVSEQGYRVRGRTIV